MITINGITTDCNGIKLLDYLSNYGYTLDYIAIEINGLIVPKDNYSTRTLQDGDAIEIVSFVGGG